MPGLASCYNVADFERAAQRRLPAPLYHYIAGAADDEMTKQSNTDAFARYELVPHYLRDVRSVDMRCKVLGCDLSWPLLLAPTGMSRMFHPDGECAVAHEAAQQGVAYSLSTMASTSIEEVAKAAAGPKIFQLYLLNDDGMNRELIDRCSAANFDALCLTVDTVWAGNRERDLRTGLTVPPRLTVRSLFDFLARPRWCANHLAGGAFTLPNIPGNDADGDLSSLAAFFAARMERHVSWERVERLIRHWGKPFAIKGLQSREDVLAAAGSGCTAVIVSNHGGRQLDGCAAPVDLIANLVDAVDERLEIILDGGVRRGTHIVKALAMGARACMLGRPYLYGLSAFGQQGVARVLKLLRDETERSLALLGCSSLDDLTREHLRAAGALPDFLHPSRLSEPGQRLKRKMG